MIVFLLVLVFVRLDGDPNRKVWEEKENLLDLVGLLGRGI